MAAPLASDSPNFWSSCAVEMNSWVCASPTVTEREHPGPAAARDLVEAFDLRHRVDHHVPDAGLDGSLQLIDRFIVARNAIRSRKVGDMAKGDSQRSGQSNKAFLWNQRAVVQSSASTHFAAALTNCGT
jgi:hypothetical protein